METHETLFCTVTGCKEPRADQDPNGSNRHCKAHRAEAQRKNRQDKLEQEHGKGFNRGVQMTKEVFATEFMNLGPGMLSGEEAAYLIMQAPGPLPRENGNGAGAAVSAKVEDKKEGAVK